MSRALLIELAGCPIAIPTGGGRCEVLTAGTVTRLPVAAPVLLGLSTIHGRAVPVVNLAHLLSVEAGGTGTATSTAMASAPDSATLTVLTEVLGELLAVPADRTLGLITLPEDSVAGALTLGTPLSLPSPDGSEILQVRVLNAAALLSGLRQHLGRV